MQINTVREAPGFAVARHIYVNVMEASVSCKLILYADDSTLLVYGKHIKTIENILGDNLLSLSNWLIDNKLSLHLSKTESILFGTKHICCQSIPN